MGSAKKPARKTVYPSFAWVVETYIFKSFARLPGQRIVWRSVPDYDTAPQPITNGTKLNWKFVPIGRREELATGEASAGVEHKNSAEMLTASSLPTLYDAPRNSIGLPPVEDDALTVVSALDLNEERTKIMDQSLS